MEAPVSDPGLDAAPEAAVQRPVVVGVIADRVDALAALDPFVDGVSLARVEARARREVRGPGPPPLEICWKS